MKKVLSVIIAIAVIGLICTLIIMGVYNGMVKKRNAVFKAWSDIEAAYQRRLDVIPKFVETAKFSVKFQEELAIKYAEAREQISTVAKKSQPDLLQTVAENAATKLLVAVRQEAVPEAKLDQLTELNAQVENIERVINHERKVYNESVFNSNNAIQTAPGKWFISWFGWNFESMEGFKSRAGSEKSPDLNLLKK